MVKDQRQGEGTNEENRALGVAEQLQHAVERNCRWLVSSQIPPEQRPIPAEFGAAAPGDLVVLPAPSTGGTATSVTSANPAADQQTGSSGLRGRLRQRVVNIRTVGGFVAHTLIDGRLDRSSKAGARATVQRFVPHRLRGFHGTLGSRGGLVFEVTSGDDGRHILRSWDHGGILDANPNTEMTPWPPQAMGMYYADAYTAAVLAHLKGQLFPNAARNALDHARRTYDRYPRAPIWYHHEFKNAPMMEAWEALGAEGDPTWMGRLHGDSYEPVNVMSVRLHWLAVRLRLLPQRGDERRLRQARSRLLASQQASGLFRDDRGSHRGVLDLSYHLFTLAFLARYLDQRPDDEVEAAFLRGVDCALAVQLDDGSVALTGRGANNVYQQAAATLAFVAAQDRRQGSQGSVLEAAALAAKPILEYQHDDGSWPTALNDCGYARMAWNHCATPYNALTSYLLSHAAEKLRTCTMRAPGERPVAKDEFARCTGAFDVVFAAGYRGSVWSGCHGSGVAGPAGLTAGGRQLLLALDHVGEDQVTMLPLLTVGGKVLDWREPGELLGETAPGAVTYRVRTGEGAITVTLRSQGQTLMVTCTGPDVGEVLARLPVMAGVKVEGLPPQGDVVSVSSNPRGPGDMYVWPMDHANGGYSWAVRVQPDGFTIL